MLDAHGDEVHPGKERKHGGTGHAGVTWHVEEGNDLEDVRDQDEEEQRGEERQVAKAVGTNGFDDDAVTDEGNGAFDQVARTLRGIRDGLERLLSTSDEEEHCGSDKCHQVDEGDFVEPVPRVRRAEQVRPFDEVLDRWKLESENHLEVDSFEAGVGLSPG